MPSPNLASATSAINWPAHIPARAEVSTRELRNGLKQVEIDELVAQLNVSTVLARILVARGVDSVEKAQAFLFPSLRDHLPDPQGIKNIATAAEMMLEAIEAGQQITIYSDFDVDGLSSGAQLDLYLSALGGIVNRYTPNRFTEGYGVVKSAIEKLGRARTELLIAVDCGISSLSEIALAKRLGMKVIVVDHHYSQELPPADVIVNPTQPGCEFKEHQLCAAGLVWMLLIVLRQCARTRSSTELQQRLSQLPDPKDFLDLAALGTICDMVPLTGLNRIIASRGVEVFRVTKRPGLEALKVVSGLDKSKNFSAGHISFAIGPRINAAGRLDDAGEVFELLTTKDRAKAQAIAEQINRYNSERKSIEDQVRLSCLDAIQAEPALLTGQAFAIFGEDFHAGVIGIVAQRLVEQYYRPAAVMAPGEAVIGGKQVAVAKGSVRSVPGFHVAEVLQSLDSLLVKHGGHAQAGGFTVSFEKLAEFQQGFVAAAARLLSPEQLKPRKLADVEVALREVDFKLVDELEKLAPFGIGNPSPLLVSHGVLIESVQSLADKHLRLRLADGKVSVGAVAWRMHGHPLLTKGREISLAFHPEMNTYQGISTVQLNIKEVWE